MLGCQIKAKRARERETDRQTGGSVCAWGTWGWQSNKGVWLRECVICVYIRLPVGRVQVCVWTEMINNPSAERKSTCEQRQSLSGRKEEQNSSDSVCVCVFCLMHWSVQIHSHTAALSLLDKLPSAWKNPGLKQSTCVIQMTGWRRLVERALWQAKENHVMLFGKSKSEWHWNVSGIIPCNTHSSMHCTITGTLARSWTFTWKYSRISACMDWTSAVQTCEWIYSSLFHCIFKEFKE